MREGQQTPDLLRPYHRVDGRPIDGHCKYKAMANKGNYKRGFKSLNDRLNGMAKALATTFPKRASADAVRFYRDSFKNQGFTDRTLVKWKKVNGKPEGRVLRGKTGLLSISVRPLKADYKGITIVAGGPHVPYAKIHNEGGTIKGTQSVRAHRRKANTAIMKDGRRVRRKAADVGAFTRTVNTTIPKRQFIGKSQVLKSIMQVTAIKTIQPFTK